jgi:hypothetical protein
MKSLYRVIKIPNTAISETAEFTVLRPAQELLTYMETSCTIAGEGLQN